MNTRDYPTLHLDTNQSIGIACSKKGCGCEWITWKTFQLFTEAQTKVKTAVHEHERIYIKLYTSVFIAVKYFGLIVYYLSVYRNRDQYFLFAEKLFSYKENVFLNGVPYDIYIITYWSHSEIISLRIIFIKLRENCLFTYWFSVRKKKINVLIMLNQIVFVAVFLTGSVIKIMKCLRKWQ